MALALILALTLGWWAEAAEPWSGLALFRYGCAGILALVAITSENFWPDLRL